MNRFVLPILTACLLFAVPSTLPAQTPAAPAANPYWDALVKDAKSRIKEIATDELAAMRKNESALVLVDVREDNEWETARAAGSVHVSRGVLESHIGSGVPRKDTVVVVYCRSGARSAMAADTLGKMGYTRVYSLAGGFTAYDEAGLAVERGAPAK